MDEDIWSQDCYDRLMSDQPGRLAIDSETTGVAWSDKAFGVSFAWYGPHEKAPVHMDDNGNAVDTLHSGYIDLRTHSHEWDMVKAWIKEYKPELIFHNAKFDMHKLGLYPNNFQDTCLMVYILNENYPKGLKVLAQKVLKEETDENTVLREARKTLGLKVSDGYDQLPLAVVAPYAIRDAEYTLRIYVRLQTALAKEPDLVEVYGMEKQLVLAVAGTELRGIGIDTDYLKEQIIVLGDEIIALERDISNLVGKPVGDGKKKLRVPDGKYKNGRPKFRTEQANEFNPNSPMQIQEYFNSVGVELSGTSEDVLAGVSHPLAEALVRLRNLRKNRNTYLVPMLEESAWDERYQMWTTHPNLNLTKTRTKRMSSSGASDG